MNNKFIKRDKKSILVFDAANLYMRCLHVTPYDPLDENFTSYKTTLLQSIRKTLLNFNPNYVIFCQEGFRNWRKDYYSLYKANRVEGREASIIDFDKFFKMNDTFIKDFANIAKNMQFLQVPRCEADDLIATIVKHKKDYEITVQSSDRDFYQLFKYNNYHQWDGTKREFIEVANPETYLTEKIILGDSGDNVPRISGLKKGKGIKFIEKNILPDIDKWLDENSMREEWERNYTLISFEAIPEEITNSIIKELDSWQQGKFDSREFYNFFFRHKLTNLFDFISDYTNVFSKF